MSRKMHKACILGICWVMLVVGCQPQQPFYLIDDGFDNSHLVNSSVIEDPDVPGSNNPEVANPVHPRTILKQGGQEEWILPLEEAVSIALANSKVFRGLGGRVVIGNSGASPDFALRGASGSVYTPALQMLAEEIALSDFDADASASFTYDKNSSPRNNSTFGVLGSFFSNAFEQDLGQFTSTISKFSATGAQFSAVSRTVYDQNNNPSRAIASDWDQQFDLQFRQPLLARGGVEFTRIAGIGGGGTGPDGFTGSPNGGNFRGIVVARTQTAQSLDSFETAIRNLVNDVEQAYWNLYFSYRNLNATRAGRDSSLATWKRIHSLFLAGAEGGEAENEAQSREQYFLFRKQMESGLNEVYKSESRLRYMLGLAHTDERLIKPADEPTTAKMDYDYQSVHAEALDRRSELRSQRWAIKRRELELIAAKNLLLPQFDLLARYRWEGLGDDLIRANGSSTGGGLAGSNALENLTQGGFNSWQAGFQLSMPIGNRKAKALVRQQEMLLSLERKRLWTQELEVSHQIADVIRDLDFWYQASVTDFNRRVAAKHQVAAVQGALELGAATLDLLLDAQRRLADADVEYYRSLVNYNRTISLVHFQKGTLLEYNGIQLAEGPWPGKAYFDSLRRSRKRDASFYFNYGGMTKPEVISRGPLGTTDQNIEGTIEGPIEVEELSAPETIDPGQPLRSARRKSNPIRIKKFSGTASRGNVNRLRSGQKKKTLFDDFDWSALGLGVPSQNRASTVVKSSRNVEYNQKKQRSSNIDESDTNPTTTQSAGKPANRKGL